MLEAQLKPSNLKQKPTIPKQQPGLDVWAGLQLDNMMSETAVKQRKNIAERLKKIEP
jgi:hypothetical protein